MKKTLTLTILAGILAIGTSGAWADGPYPTNLTDGTFGGAVGTATPNSNTNEFELYNAVNLLLGSSYTNNAQLDSLEYTGNTSTWQQTGTGGYAVIGLGAGATNTLEVYNTATPGTVLNPIGGGFSGDGSTGNGTLLSPYVGTGSVIPVGNQFGFVLNQSYNGVITNWNSNPALNSDGMDHMIVYNLSSLSNSQIYVTTPGGSEQLVTLHDPYLVGFEDLPLNNGGPSDEDFNDLIVLVDGVAPVPEPMTLALFGFGLLAMVGFAMRRKFAIVR